MNAFAHSVAEKNDSALLPAKIICGDAVVKMAEIADETVDIVITSPPYDNIRDYKGFTLDLSAAGRQIFRVLKDGGIAVVVL